MSSPPPPFSDFAPPVSAPSPMRRAITAATRLPEAACVAALLPAARMPDELKPRIRETALALVTGLRAGGERGGVEGLVKEYALSSREGVALMCLAEALLRIPDDETRDALIRDKIATGDWRSHLGPGRSLFVNAATWGLVVTGRLVGDHGNSLGAALTRLIGRAGEPVIRRGVDLAMELMGEQFVAGETIASALRRARRQEAQGFTHSYDMLGEAATTAADAARYLSAYEQAIAAIGAASGRRGVHAGPGISIKLSALHPRYSRAQARRVIAELLPRLRGLALEAKRWDIGFNIDAEEADRLELSLDLLESLALDPDLAGWDGLGFVVQAYGKRCPAVIDWLVDLARRSGHRLMIRLVKGAYWDSEIKRAQVDGQADFPVFTRKVHTDVSYIACASKLLAARAEVFPQFATHNAQTLATIHHLAGADFTPGDWEFQCLHGMGESLYEQVVGAAGLNRPCRIYAPVGTHETLLAYLVRRLLENGANSSFVHRIHDPAVPPEALAADPHDEALAVEPVGSPHPLVALPAAILGNRRNSAGIDLADEGALAALAAGLHESAGRSWNAAPLVPGLEAQRRTRPVTNPADRRDIVGSAAFAQERDADLAAGVAARAAPRWAQTPVAERAASLLRAADHFQQHMPMLMGLAMREAGKSAANAIAEVREAIDFLRYYALEAERTLAGREGALGPAVCISPWNFPLAIFTGQIAAALAAGNPVLAKPAEETPLIAAEAVRLLHEAGIPADVLQLVPGEGTIGARLVQRPETAAVLFTGSTEVAKAIQQELAGHVTADGLPVPLIAETGGQNAMIVDASALPEQVTADVLASAFDSAGQRCSALRVLCLQDDIADRQLAMIEGALAELAVGNPCRLATDIGPVITDEARDGILAHIERMRGLGCRVIQAPLPAEVAQGSFVPPTIVLIDSIEQIGREVFGPVLHVLKWQREDLGGVIAAINETGYGLTFGLHTRIDETIERVTAAIGAGNIYVNRNTIGAVVGVQPFGGRGLSGTGPKAGGPLYLGRLVKRMPATGLDLAGVTLELPGPVGERNLYTLHPRREILMVAHSDEGLARQRAAIAAIGGTGMVVRSTDDLPARGTFAAVLVERGGDIPALLARIAGTEGPIPLVQVESEDGYRLDWLVEEVSTSINTTAAGGNASLMALV